MQGLVAEAKLLDCGCEPVELFSGDVHVAEIKIIVIK